MNHKAARPPRLQLLLKAERRIILASTLLVLLTGILVSIAVTLPMYRSIRIQLEEVSLANASARQSSIEHQLDIYQSLAEQFSSRTEIRKRLEAWLNGETSLEQLRQFSLPRLQEPASRIPELAGMFRVSNGKLITALGELSALVDNLPLQPASAGLAFHALDNDRILIKASAPIRSTDQRTIGHDVLFFHADSLLHHLHGFSGYGDRAKIFLYQESPQTALGLSAATGLPEQALQREALQPFLQQPQLQQPGIHKTRSPQNDILIVRPFAGMPVHLIISIPEQVFYAPAYHDLLGVHILILLLLILAILASRLAIRPLISTLTRQTREIEASRAELQLAASVF